MNLKVAARKREGNLNHHLWNNHGSWWCHFTVHLPDFTKKRVRLALDTDDACHARRLRDTLFLLLCVAQSQPLNGANVEGAKI